MLYNDKYHWLLIEDYSLHVKAGVVFLAEHPRLELTDEDKDKETDTDRNGNVDKDAKADELEPIESLMETLNFYMNTEVTLAKRQRQDDSYALYDVWYVASPSSPSSSSSHFHLPETTVSVSCPCYLLVAGDSEC